MAEWTQKSALDLTPIGDTTSEAIIKLDQNQQDVYDKLNRVRKLDASKTAPADQVDNSLWLSTNEYALKRWNGTNWARATVIGVSTEQELLDAISGIGTKEGVIEISEPILLTANRTIPENINLRFMKGAYIDSDTAYGTFTLTINGGIDAGLYRIFGDNVTVSGSPKIEAVYPEWFGAVGDGVNDDTQAIRKALAISNTKCGQGKTFLISDTITIDERKLDLNGSWLIQNDNTKPIIIITGVSEIKNFKLKHNTWDETVDNTTNIGIQVGTDTKRCERRSRIENGYIERVSSGIYYTGMGGYSNIVQNIEFNKWTIAMLYIDSDGLTGSLFKNLYGSNWLDYQNGIKTTAKGGIFVQGYIDECEFEQINIEHSIITNNGITINNAGNMSFRGLHFEGIECSTDYMGLVNIINSRKVLFEDINLVFSSITSPTEFYFFAIDGQYAKKPYVIARGVTERGNTITTPSLKFIYKQNGDAFVEYVKFDSENNWADFVTQNSDGLSSFVRKERELLGFTFATKNDEKYTIASGASITIPVLTGANYESWIVVVGRGWGGCRGMYIVSQGIDSANTDLQIVYETNLTSTLNTDGTITLTNTSTSNSEVFISKLKLK